MSSVVLDVAAQLQTQSLNSVVAGFAFASAIAWMDVVRWFISQIVQVSKNGGQYYILSALFTTLLSIIVFMLIKKFSKVEVKEPSVAYAVTGR
jgi:hypothetical protein